MNSNDMTSIGSLVGLLVLVGILIFRTYLRLSDKGHQRAERREFDWYPE